jgi:hypothetical protein
MNHSWKPLKINYYHTNRHRQGSSGGLNESLMKTIKDKLLSHKQTGEFRRFEWITHENH